MIMAVLRRLCASETRLRVEQTRYDLWHYSDAQYTVRIESALRNFHDHFSQREKRGWEWNEKHKQIAHIVIYLHLSHVFTYPFPWHLRIYSSLTLCIISSKCSSAWPSRFIGDRNPAGLIECNMGSWGELFKRSRLPAAISACLSCRFDLRNTSCASCRTSFKRSITGSCWIARYSARPISLSRRPSSPLFWWRRYQILPILAHEDLASY